MTAANVQARETVALARPEIRALKPYASARALADAAGILLNANESPWPPAGDEGLALNRYPDPQPAELKQRLADLYGTGTENLLVTRGSDEGIDLLLRVFCRPGTDRVLVCPPCFGMYALSARVQGAEVVEAPLVDLGETFDLAPDLEEKSAGCRIIFLCSPNNPTGNVIDAERVAALAEAQAGEGLVVVDEAYVEFAPETSMLRLLERHPNLVLLRTLSKAHGLAGCRLGSVIAHPEIIGLLRRIIAPYPLPTPTVRIALRAWPTTRWLPNASIWKRWPPSARACSRRWRKTRTSKRSGAARPISCWCEWSTASGWSTTPRAPVFGCATSLPSPAWPTVSGSRWARRKRTLR